MIKKRYVAVDASGDTLYNLISALVLYAGHNNAYHKSGCPVTGIT